MKSLLPAITIATVAVYVYWDTEALHGEFVYDDAGTVVRNPVVQPSNPWQDVFTHDFWGTLLTSNRSHKSFRPITSMTFRWNIQYGSVNDVFPFHVVNLFLHGLVSGLSVLVGLNSGSSLWVSTLAGLFFAIHPIHTEAVSNVSSRAELLMSLFYMLGFLVYATATKRTMLSAVAIGKKTDGQIPESKRSRHVLANIFACSNVLMLTVASLLSKEHGVTLPFTCLIYDFCVNDMTVTKLLGFSSGGGSDLEAAVTRHNRSQIFQRVVFFALGLMGIAYVRLLINGDSAPDLIPDQNPAAFADDFLTRSLSVPFVYCLYIQSFLLPYNLCCDWSGKSIQLVESFSDPRSLFVVVLEASFFGFLYRSLLAKASRTAISKDNKLLLQYLLGWTAVPFLLSSNLLVKTGFMKAERVMYLPSLGLCFAMAFALAKLNKRLAPNRAQRHFADMHWFVYCIVLGIVVVYVVKTTERNLAWGHPLKLWTAAYHTNPISKHTRYNYSLELSRAQRGKESLPLIEKLVEDDPDDFASRFLLALVLRSLGRCKEVGPIIDEGLALLEEAKITKAGSVRANFKADESRLISGKAVCTDDIPLRGKLLYEAVELDPGNKFALEEGEKLLALVNQYKKEAARQNQV